MQAVLLSALVLPWLVIAFLAWLLFILVRQHGRALISQEEINKRLAALEQSLPPPTGQPPAPTMPTTQASAAGLLPGDQAPEFVLPDLGGRERRLREFLDRPLVLTFFSTTCGFCLQMAPRLGKLPAEPGFLLVSRGDAGEHRRLMAENGWKCDVLLDQDMRVMQAYQASGTPMGYLVDAEGKIASHLAIGADAVLELLGGAPPVSDGHLGGLTAESLREQQSVAVERARQAGLAVRESKLNREGLSAGTMAPDFELPDLKGGRHSLKEFVGRRLLLVFSDPDCAPCNALAPELLRLCQRERSNNLQVLMVSRGDPAANHAKITEHGFDFPVLLQKHWEVSKDYAMFATPIAYLIDEEGRILKDVAVGGEAILQLV